MKTYKTLIALIGLCAILSLSTGTNAAKENFDRSKPHLTISVNIGGVDFGTVEGLRGLGVLSPEEELKHPGRTTYSDVTLKRGYTGSTDLQEWATKASTEGELCRDCTKNIKIIMINRSGEVVRTFNLIDTFPIRWGISTDTDNSGSRAVETLEIRVNRIEMA